MKYQKTYQKTDQELQYDNIQSKLVLTVLQMPLQRTQNCEAIHLHYCFTNCVCFGTELVVKRLECIADI